MIQLKEIVSENIWKIVNLNIKAEQKDFIASNIESILEAYVYAKENVYAQPFGIYDDESPIGFVMIGYDKSFKSDPEIAIGNYSIWRFMIDKDFQGKGLGKAAFKVVLDFIRTQPHKEAQYCWLSYEPDNIIAKNLYASFGFKENGEFDEEEVVAVIKL